MTHRTVTFLNIPLVVRKGFIDYPYFANLGMLQNVAVVKAHGWSVHVLDAFAQAQSGLFSFNGGYHIGCTLKDYLTALESVPSDLVVIAGNPFLKVDRRQVYVRKVLERIKALRSESVIILADCYVGGMHYIDYAPEDVFEANPEIDYIVKYHGEAALPALLAEIKNELTREYPNHTVPPPLPLGGVGVSGPKERSHVKTRVRTDQTINHPRQQEAFIDGRRSHPFRVFSLLPEERSSTSPQRHGVSAREKKRVWIGKAADVSFDELPFPAWDEISMQHYFSFLKRGFRTLGFNPLLTVTGRTLPVLTSRGCVFSCVFCSSNPDERSGRRKTYHAHAPSYLADYLDHLLQRYGVDKVVILDEIANLKPDHFEEIVKLLNDRNVAFAIPNGLRADKLTKRVLERMKGRLDMLSISAESADPYVLREIVKGKSMPGAIEKVAGWCKEIRLPLLIHYIIGFPGETEAQINRTLFDALRMNREYGAQISLQYATPLPGTELHEMSRRQGLLPDRDVPDYSEWFSKEPLIESGVDRAKLRLFKKNFELALNTKLTKKIIVNMTYKCNNHCIFCATGDMPPIDADVKKTKAKLKHAFANGIRQLDFDGGEPTLHPGLFEVIRFARELGFQEINLTTNGRLLAYPGFARKTVNSGINSLLISLHGHSRELHLSSTSEAESFQQTVAGIKNALQYKPPYLRVGVNITLTRMNYFQLRDFAEFVFSLGIRILNIQFLTPFGRATKAMVPPMDATTKSVKEVIEEFASRMTINLANIQPCFMKGYEDYALADFAKSERQMLFCTDYAENLYHYLSHKRLKTEVCHSCPYSIICAGFYDFESKANNAELQGIAL